MGEGLGEGEDLLEFRGDVGGLEVVGGEQGVELLDPVDVGEDGGGGLLLVADVLVRRDLAQRFSVIFDLTQ